MEFNYNMNTSGRILNTDEDSYELKRLALIVSSYIPILLIVVALFGNTLSLIIFRLDGDMKKMSSLTYLSFIALVDMCALLGWNLNNFLFINFKTRIEDINVIVCHVTTFIQFVSMQSSGILLSMTCIDRYFTIISTPGSFVSSLPFSTARSALVWSLILISLVCVINLHVLVYPFDIFFSSLLPPTPSSESLWSYLSDTKPFICHEYQQKFTNIDTWHKVNFYIYSLIPFIIVAIFNGLTIWKTFDIRKYFRGEPSRTLTGDTDSPKPSKTSLKSSSFSLVNMRVYRKRKRISISLVIITFSFPLFTLPSNTAFAYFFVEIQKHELVWIWLDNLLFSYNASLFFFSYMSNPKFRQAVKKLFSCQFTFLRGARFSLYTMPETPMQSRRTSSFRKSMNALPSTSYERKRVNSILPATVSSMYRQDQQSKLSSSSLLKVNSLPVQKTNELSISEENERWLEPSTT